MAWTIYYKGVTGYQGSVTVDETAVSAGGLELAIIADETNSGGSTTIDGADSLTYADCYDTMYVYRNGVPVSDLTTENGKGFLNATLIQDGDTVICTVWTAGNKRERQQIKLGVAQIKRKALMYATPTDAPFYHPNNTFETDDLPTVYNTNGTSLTDNANAEGLLPKRPWTAVSAIAAPTSIAEAVDGGTLPDLQVWYDGADTNTYIPSATDEGQITQWTDKSNFAHNANPDGGSAKPSYENTSLQGGHGYLEFDGNDSLSVNPFTQLNGANAFTLFVVSNVRTASGAEYFTDTDTADFGMYSDGGTVKLTMNGYTRTTDATVSANAWHQHTLIYSGSGTPSLTYRLNRTTAGTSASTGSIPATTGAAGTFYIGNNNATSSGLSGYVAEVVMFNRTLSSTEYQNVENYLKTKWGL